MAADARGRAAGYAEAAGMLSEAAARPMTAWQALKDAVAGAGSDGAAALEAAKDSADRFEEALGAAGQAATEAGAAAGAAASAAAPSTERAVTGWQAVTAALSDYATKARSIGGDIGQSLVGAFRSAEKAVAQFVKTGKLEVRDLVTSLIADLAQLAARRFILGPIAGGTGIVDQPRLPRFKAFTNYDNYVGVGAWTKIAINNTDYNDQSAFDAANNRFVAPVDGTYLFGATLMYKVNASTSSLMSGRLVLNGTTEIRGSFGEISGAHVSEATALWLQTMVPLTAGDTIELQGNFRAADGYFAADQTSLWGAKIG
jgi:hypothetical protein